MSAKLLATWTRRRFLANAGLASAAMVSPLSRDAAAAEGQTYPAQSFLACVASRSAIDAPTQHLEAFVIRGRDKYLVAQLQSLEPIGAIVLHPTRNVLYAAYDTSEYLGLPGASVAVFSIERSTGTFVLLDRRALTLSATNPRNISISPDGATLLVSASGGGAYNSFGVAADGVLDGPPRALKLTGCGPHPLQSSARPGFSAFHRSGRYAYACDFGSDRIDQLAFVDGVPGIVSRAHLLPGSDPCHLAIHPSERAIAVVSQLRPEVTIIRIDPDSVRLGLTSHRALLESARLSRGYFDASGHALSVVGTTNSGAPAVSTYRVAQPDFTLRQVLSANVDLEPRLLIDNLALSGRTPLATTMRSI